VAVRPKHVTKKKKKNPKKLKKTKKNQKTKKKKQEVATKKGNGDTCVHRKVTRVEEI